MLKQKFNNKDKVKNSPGGPGKFREDKAGDIEELFERFEDLKVASCINHAANMGKSLKEIIKLFSDQTKKLLSSSGATVYLLSDDGKSLIMQNYTTPRNILRKIESLIRIKIKKVELPVLKGGFYHKALVKKKPLIINKPEDIRELILEFVEGVKPKSKLLYKSIKKLIPVIYRIIGINSAMIVPLIVENKSVGIIDIGSKKIYESSDMERMRVISGEVTAVINRKLIEDKLNYTNKELNILLEMNVEGVRFIDSDFNVIKVNKKFYEISGVDKKKNFTRKCYEVFHCLDCGKTTCTLKQILGGVKKVKKEIDMTRMDKIIIPCIITALPLKDVKGKIIGIAENFYDISEVRKAEKSILKSKKKYRELAETLDEIIVDLDLKGNITYANKKAFDETGYTQEDVDRGFNIMHVVVPMEKMKVTVNFIKLLMGKKTRGTSIYKIKRKDGSTFRAVVHPNYLLDGKGKLTGIRVVLVDLSDIETAEKKVKESEEEYRLLFENSLDGIYRTTLGGKYIDVNPSLIKMLGYDSKEELLAIDIPTQLYVRKKDRPGPADRNKLFETRLRRKDGSIIAVEINSRVVYKGGKPVSYEGMVRDITERKAAQKKAQESYQKLQKMLDDVIYTLSSIVGIKDPYTYGHQKRSALLAVAIAEELGLDKKKVELINIAALIHDIGKINLPASILNKPGKLTKVEYDMVKTHAKLGFDMVAHIDFPKVVTDIILQHHERIDGSGYPLGLKGDEIIPEARIMAVADVVEAMSSHRPYRPALGVKKAMEEIKKGMGKLFDPKVVNTCIKVINNKKVDLETPFE